LIVTVEKTKAVFACNLSQGVSQWKTVGADSISALSISAKDTGAEIDSAPTPAKLIVFTDIKLTIYKICS